MVIAEPERMGTANLLKIGADYLSRTFGDTIQLEVINASSAESARSDGKAALLAIYSLAERNPPELGDLTEFPQIRGVKQGRNRRRRWE